MMSPLKISIAMCTFNGEDYLCEQLTSIACQTRLPDELVISDDASSDATLEILRLFEEASNFKVKIITSKFNRGVNKNFENAVANCTGDIIVFADQDDLWMPNKIETIEKCISAHPNCGYVFSDAELIDSAGQKIGKRLWNVRGFREKQYLNFTKDKQLEVMLKEGHFIYGMTMAFKAEYKDIVLPIITSPNACTHDTWTSLLLSGIGAKGIAIKAPLVLYRQHDKQVAGGYRTPFFVKLMKRFTTNRSDANLPYADALEIISARLLVHQKRYNVENRVIEQLRAKTAHLRARAIVRSLGWPGKIRIVMRELMAGRYGRYSRKMTSVVKDLLITKSI